MESAIHGAALLEVPVYKLWECTARLTRLDMFGLVPMATTDMEIP